MKDGVELPKSLLGESVQRVLEENESSEKFYNTLNNNGECTICHTVITRDIYKKNRTTFGSVIENIW